MHAADRGAVSHATESQTRGATQSPRTGLPPALEGARETLDGQAGRLTLYASPATDKSGTVSGRPLLLIHSINAAGSSYEVKPIYDHYRTIRPVYALDLPGFGLSDRSDREYTPRLMTDAIHHAVDWIRQKHGEGAIDALAVSLSCEFLSRAATERAECFRSVALVSPTGFDKRAPYLGDPGSTRGNAFLYGLFTVPLWSRAFFNALTSRRSIRYFLKKTWGSPAIDEALLDYDYLTTHQPGAWHAPYYFVAGYLFGADITRVYDALRLPVWMVHGVRGDFIDYSYAATMAGRENWSIDVLPTGALPHFEVADDFARDYDTFLAKIEAPR